MITYLGWSLLGIAEDFDPLKATDFPSESLARILYAGFLIMGAILLINMLIALLSNTYQRIKDNSLKEWSFKSAVTIQTYDGYDPIPVPLNIIYSVAKLLGLVKKKEKEQVMLLEFLIIDLDREYFAKYGNFLPGPDEEKDDPVAQETCGNRKMISQILNSTFKFQGAFDNGIMCPVGLEAWEAHTGIRIEGNHLTCEEDAKRCPECGPSKRHWPGARYLKSLSPEFPHFEVAILETGKQIMMAIGIVIEGYDTGKMPGWENGTVGYQTDGNIYDAEHKVHGRPTKGPVLAFRGDQIRCTVMFEEKQESQGKARVPICFTLNGRKILIKSTRHHEETDRVFMDYDKPLYPYIGMTEGCSVLAKMCSRENAEHEISKNEELTKKVTKIEESLEETNRKLDLMCSSENAHAEQEISKTEDLTRKVTKLEQSLEETNRKLDTLLSRLTHQEQSCSPKDLT